MRCGLLSTIFDHLLLARPAMSTGLCFADGKFLNVAAGQWVEWTDRNAVDKKYYG